jgi:VWFA-related protein
LAQQPAAQAPVQIQLPAQSSTADGQILTLRAEARAVLVDVTVNDRSGHAIHGLTAKDFQLREDGVPQTITSLEEHHPPSAAELTAAAAPALPPNTWSNFQLHPKDGATRVVFLLDTVNTPITAQMYARGELLNFFKEMQPGTEVAIFELGLDLRLLQGFTSDAEVLRKTIKDRDKPALTPLQGPGYAVQAFKMDALTHAMQSLGSYLSQWPGRKNLVWFTAHIPRVAYDDGSAVGGALHDAEAFDYSKATASLVLGQVSIFPIDTRGLETDPAYSAANGRAPSRNSGTRFATRQFFQHTDLDAVAEATGGKAFYNTNGIKQVVNEVVEDGTSYYTLSFTPTNKVWDGKFRRLKLTVEPGEGRSNPELHYRPGYYAVAETAPLGAPHGVAPPVPAPDPAGRIQLTHSTPTEDQVVFNQAMQLGAVDPGLIRFSAHVDENAALGTLPPNLSEDEIQLVPKFRDKPFREAKIYFRVGGSQVDLVPGAQGIHTGKINFVAAILDDKGQLVSYSAREIDMKINPETYAKARRDGMEMLVPIRIPAKGAYFLRAGVHDLQSGKSGALEVSTAEIKVGH